MNFVTHKYIKDKMKISNTISQNSKQAVFCTV